MGQQSSSLKNLSYKITKEIQTNVVEPKNSQDKYQWTLFEGLNTKSQEKISIICLEPSTSPYSINIYKRFKTLRHPNLLPFLDGIELNQENKFYIITEPIVPLQTQIQALHRFPESIPLGVYQVSNALTFLNKECKLVHGNVNLSTVYVNSQGDWKLCGFDFISSIDEVRNSSGLLSDVSKLATGNLQWPPEMLLPAPKRYVTLRELLDHSIDSWLFACFFYSIYNWKSLPVYGSKPFDMNKLKDISNLPQQFVDKYTKLLSYSPKNRMPTESVQDSPYFKNNFVETCLFLQNLSVKDKFEKESFFKTLATNIQNFSDSCKKDRFLPALINAMEFGETDANAVAVILELGEMLTPQEYNARLLTPVLRWFSSLDRSMRTALLQGINLIVPHLSEKQITNSVWPQLCQGFTDVSPSLRELTVRSLPLLAPKLGSKILNCDALKYLAMAQADQVPVVRTNATVCIGKLANHLKPEIRQKILVPAFSRALKDTFTPSRRAGLFGLMSAYSQKFFSAEDIAKRVMPNVCFLCVDQNQEIKTEAIKALKTLIGHFEEGMQGMLVAPEIQEAKQSPAMTKGRPEIDSSQKTDDVLNIVATFSPIQEPRDSRQSRSSMKDLITEVTNKNKCSEETFDEVTERLLTLDQILLHDWSDDTKKNTTSQRPSISKKITCMNSSQNKEDDYENMEFDFASVGMWRTGNQNVYKRL